MKETKEKIEYIYDEEKVFGVVERLVLEDLLKPLTGWVYEKQSIETKFTDDKFAPYFHSAVQLTVKFNPQWILPTAPLEPILNAKEDKQREFREKVIKPLLLVDRDCVLTFTVAFSRNHEMGQELYSMGVVQRIG